MCLKGEGKLDAFLAAWLRVPFRSLLALQNLALLAESLGTIFIGFYLWENGSLATLIRYQLFLAATVPFAAFLAAFLIDRVSAKLVFAVGLAVFFLQIAGVLVLKETILGYVTVFGVVTGFSAAFRFFPENVISQVVVPADQQKEFYANLTIVTKVSLMVFPILSGFLKVLFGYNAIFFLTLAFIGASFLLLLRLPLVEKPNPFRPQAVLFHLNREKISLFFTNCLWGIEASFLATLVPVVTVLILGGFGGWGIFTTALSALGIAFAFLYGRTDAKTPPQGAIGIFGLFLAAAALVFAANYNLASFSFFMVVLTLWQTVQTVGLRPLLTKIVARDTKSQDLTTEYSYFQEIPFAVGRTLMLVFLLAASSRLETGLAVGVLFALLSFVPILFEGALALSREGKYFRDEPVSE